MRSNPLFGAAFCLGLVFFSMNLFAQAKSGERKVESVWSVMVKSDSNPTDVIAVVFDNSEVEILEKGQPLAQISLKTFQRQLNAAPFSVMQSEQFYQSAVATAYNSREHYFGTYRGDYKPGNGQSFSDITINEKGCALDGKQAACIISLDEKYADKTIQLEINGSFYTFDILVSNDRKFLQLREHVVTDGKPDKNNYFFARRENVLKRVWEAVKW